MKKNGILKALGILFLICIVVGWIIPAGHYADGAFTKDANVMLGFVDLIKYPIITFTSSVFVLTGIVILFIGGLYGVLNKTTVYSKIVKDITKKFKGKETKFLIISVLVFSILTSLTGLVLPIFVLVPLFVAVILSLGYSKVTALISTVGAMLVGNVGSTYGFNINGYISYLYGTSIHATIWARIIILILTTSLLLYFVIKSKKVNQSKKTKEEEIVIPLYEDTKTSKSTTKMIVISTIMFIITLVGMYNWSKGFGITIFEDLHTKIASVEISGVAVFTKLIGTLDPIGYWGNYDLAVILLVTSFIIGKAYGLKLKDIAESFIKGCKEMAPVAIYACIANVIFLFMNTSTYSYFGTISDWLFNLTKTLNIVTVGISSLIGGFLFNDFPYMINAVSTEVAGLTKHVTLMALVQQTIHGLVCLVAPTSVILVAGLKFLDVSYKEWLKNIWKYVLLALLAVTVIIIIMALI